MKTLLSIVLLLVLSLTGFAQTAQVIQLSAEDSAKAKSLDEALQAAVKASRDFTNYVEVKYTQEPFEGHHSNAYCSTYINASVKRFCFINKQWNNGFEYSTDYRFIVPVQTSIVYTDNLTPKIYCSMITPAGSISDYQVK